MHREDDEQYWIERASQGDQRAYKKLYDSHVEQLFRFLKQFSGNSALVEEWVQRAFIKAYVHLETFKGNSRFSTWLISIAMNEMKSDFRKKNNFILPDDNYPELHIESEEERFAWQDSMRELLQELGEQQRSVFLLYEVEGYSHAEIASILHIGENASRTMLCRTKQWLRTQWELMEKAV